MGLALQPSALGPSDARAHGSPGIKWQESRTRVVGEFVDAMTLVEHGSHDWADWAQSTMAEAVDIK